MTAVLIIHQDDIFKSPWSKFHPDYEADYNFTGMNDFESSFIQFCIMYGFIIWLVKFISVLAMRLKPGIDILEPTSPRTNSHRPAVQTKRCLDPCLKLQYSSFVFPFYLSFVGLFLIYHFYEIKITLFDIGNGETEFHSGQFYYLK